MSAHDPLIDVESGSPHGPVRAAIPRQRRTPTRGPHLAVRLLGPWQVSVDGCAVGPWPSPLRRSLFAYLLVHRQGATTPDRLADVFWPAAPVAAARNNLHVAMHGVRKVLRSAIATPVIVFADGGYRVAPDVRVWLDSEEFDGRMRYCRRLEHECRPCDIVACAYEDALDAHSGDFLADTTGAEWTAGPRERLRLAHLEALGRLSALYLDQGRDGLAADICTEILERDPFREDVARRLMRCHARRGHVHLAVLTFRSLVRALDELGIVPSPATTALHDRLRTRRPV